MVLGLAVRESDLKRVREHCLRIGEPFRSWCSEHLTRCGFPSGSEREVVTGHDRREVVSQSIESPSDLGRGQVARSSMIIPNELEEDGRVSRTAELHEQDDPSPLLPPANLVNCWMLWSVLLQIWLECLFQEDLSKRLFVLYRSMESQFRSGSKPFCSFSTEIASSFLRLLTSSRQPMPGQSPTGTSDARLGEVENVGEHEEDAVSASVESTEDDAIPVENHEVREENAHTQGAAVSTSDENALTVEEEQVTGEISVQGLPLAGKLDAEERLRRAAVVQRALDDLRNAQGRSVRDPKESAERQVDTAQQVSGAAPGLQLDRSPPRLEAHDLSTNFPKCPAQLVLVECLSATHLIMAECGSLSTGDGVRWGEWWPSSNKCLVVERSEGRVIFEWRGTRTHGSLWASARW
ncbi:hypothetical protein FOZ63_000609 [Perkinsus olseni]|uniref:Uncharacterized protein n=1 Tax=Perkinsus olseni TaxID=32597 RepID=A0A7J6SDK9_PEROL|nr:hypothetical protein FOZ60_015857 [Perkinsus olseni]KAF4713593.1 hypothetical protein FOZ62_000381 [Perkinsus olseni]KAF4730190.1 hypothetical protein FOZ63_000609 [Perkinsus olseni]